MRIRNPVASRSLNYFFWIERDSKPSFVILVPLHFSLGCLLLRGLFFGSLFPHLDGKCAFHLIGTRNSLRFELAEGNFGRKIRKLDAAPFGPKSRVERSSFGLVALHWSELLVDGESRIESFR